MEWNWVVEIQIPHLHFELCFKIKLLINFRVSLWYFVGSVNAGVGLGCEVMNYSEIADRKVSVLSLICLLVKTIINGSIIGIIGPIHAAVRVGKSVGRRPPSIGGDCPSVIFDCGLSGRQGGDGRGSVGGRGS
jgi:hypothetical protein